MVTLNGREDETSWFAISVKVSRCKLLDPGALPTRLVFRCKYIANSQYAVIFLF